MFWALEMEPAKVYKQKVEKTYHISMACLQPSKCTDNNYTSLVVKKADNQFVLCNLHKEKAMQVQLDLMFGKGEEITFLLTGGRNKVYLSGYIMDEDEDQLFEESESELEDNVLEQELQSMGKRKNIKASPVETKNKKAKIEAEKSSEGSGEESDDEEEDEDDEMDEEGEVDEDEEVGSSSESDDELTSDEENTPTKISPAKSPNQSKKKTPNVNQSINEKMQQKTPVNTPVSQVNGKTPLSKKKKDKANKTPGGNESFTTPKAQKTPETPKEATPQKMKLEGGVVAIDSKIGIGPPAKAGNKVAVYYTGRLQQNNKQFDSTTQGKGYVFPLGRGMVIKGWDVGVAGMKVGGKRKLIIPAAMAYGNKGSPPVIPPNANLVFEVELRNIL